MLHCTYSRNTCIKILQHIINNHQQLAVHVFRCRHNMAPPYLSRDFHWTDEAGVTATTTVRLSAAPDCSQNATSHHQ